MELLFQRRFVHLFCVGTTVLLGTILGQCASAADILLPLDLRQAKVGGEIGRRIDITINNNLLKIDIEKDFLPFVRAKKGVPKWGNYLGLGKLIDGAVKLAAYSQNEKAIAVKKRLIDETIKSQEADGYIGLMPPNMRMWELWDVHEMNYILFALVSDYHYFGDKRSLTAACKTGDYLIGHWKTMPPNWVPPNEALLHTAFIGLERGMLALHHETGDRRYLDFAIHAQSLPDWDLGIVIGRRHQCAAHSYAYIERCLAKLDLDHVQPNDRLWQKSRLAMDFITHRDGMTITGGVGQDECWTDDQDGRDHLGETCSTAYQIWLYDYFLRREGDSRYGDFMERTIYNALFAAQSPDGRRLRYWAPFEGVRPYWDADVYCCPGNYRRIVAELPTMVYYKANDGVAVNLYTPSETAVPVGDGVSLKIRQETDYPSTGHVAIHLDPSKPATFPLQLRIPKWCRSAKVAINGEPLNKPITPGTFVTLARQWKSGDRVTLDMPMEFRFVLGRKRQAGRAAIMRGPVVFCLNPANVAASSGVDVPVRQDQLAAIRGKDGADLGRIFLNPDSLKLVPKDDSVRPDGVACEVKAVGAGWTDVRHYAELTLRLTEFPDPNGKCIYFRVPELTVAAPDELATGDGVQRIVFR